MSENRKIVKREGPKVCSRQIPEDVGEVTTVHSCCVSRSSPFLSVLTGETGHDHMILNGGW